VASWSSIDYYGKWKALHYAAKKSFENFLVSYENTDDNINVFVISDSLKSINAQLKVRLLDFDGNELKQWAKDIEVEGNNSNKHLALLKNDFTNDKTSSEGLLYAQLILNDKLLAENTYYLSPYKALDFPEPELTYSIKENNDKFIVRLSTKKLAKDVFLSSGSDANFTDNYFDMLPNSEKTITVQKSADEDLESFKSNLKVVTLVDSYGN
jgi:beta-mannosidase